MEQLQHQPQHQPENDMVPEVRKTAHIRPAQAENYRLDYTDTEQQQFRGTTVEELAYNAIERHTAYHSTEASYNEKRVKYTEQAFNDRMASAEDGGSGSTSPQHEKSETKGSAENIGTNELSPGIILTAEAPKLWANTYSTRKNEEALKKLDEKRADVQRAYTRLTYHGTTGDISTKKRLLFSYYGKMRLTGGQNSRDVELAKSKSGRLEYSGHIEREKMNRKDMDRRMQKADIKSFKRRAAGRLMSNKGISLVNDESLAEDEYIADVKRLGKRAGRGAAMLARRSVRALKARNNVYAGYELEEMKQKVLKNNRDRLMSDSEKKIRKQQLREAQSREQRKKLKKKMVQQRAVEEGSFYARTRHQSNVKRTKRKYEQIRNKRFLSTLSATFMLAILAVILVMLLILIIVAATQGGTELYADAVTQNDYGTLTEAAAYFRNLETDMDEYLNADREALEAGLETEYGPDIYEYIYELADFGFSANSLMAYLSTVYGSFGLPDIRDELDEIFSEMYTLIIEVRLEEREAQKYNYDTHEFETVMEEKKICHITLEKRELEEVLEARLPEDLKFQYDSYKLSSGGQQVYAPVMREDWTNRITSNYGERIHPITKQRKMHKGVDIGVPEGTRLYSAVKGVVTKSNYSESAGNQVTVQTESGWSVTFMHMSSRAVSAGQKVEQGDFLGLSGNTGNSTGPHLHLQVEDADRNTINPIFIIPQSCAMLEKTEEQKQ